MHRETAGESALELAARRLERAVVALEQRLSQATAAGASDDLFNAAKAGGEAELDRAQARARDLEAAGAEASAALGRAIEEIRTAMNGQPPPAEQ
jgi:hypothetical protein